MKSVRIVSPGGIALRPIGLRLLLVLAVFGLQIPLIHARVELAPCKNKYSPEQQIELGQKVKAQVYRQMPVLPDSSPVTQ